MHVTQPRAAVVADAFVAQMSVEDGNLRNCKTELEAAIAAGGELSVVTDALAAANDRYKAASAQIRRNCAPPKAAKSKAKPAA